jgi:carbon monoxide dehydrogenase subunit G
MTTVSGERRFAASPERVFALLTDPAVIAAAIPSVRGHRVIDRDHWEAKVKPPVPFAPSLTIRFEVIQRREPQHAGLHAHGGGADVTSTFDLSADGESSTLMQWRAELHLTGVIDRLVGHRLDSVARNQAERTLDSVERAL